MVEETLRNEKTWGAEDTIKYLKMDVDVLNARIKQAEISLETLKDRRNSLDIGRYILEKIQEERSQSLQPKASKGGGTS